MEKGWMLGKEHRGGTQFHRARCGWAKGLLYKAHPEPLYQREGDAVEKVEDSGSSR